MFLPVMVIELPIIAMPRCFERLFHTYAFLLFLAVCVPLLFLNVSFLCMHILK